MTGSDLRGIAKSINQRSYGVWYAAAARWRQVYCTVRYGTVRYRTGLGWAGLGLAVGIKHK